MADRARVFVSHHHSPEEDVFTARLVKDLEAAGADVWVDDQRIASDDFIKKINEGLAGRQWLVLVMTPNALRSQWVQAEVNAALNQMRKGRMLGVVPIVAKPCDDEDIPPLWDPLHRYDATSAYEPARDGLFRALGLSMPAPPSAPIAVEPTFHAAAPQPHPRPLSDEPAANTSAGPPTPAQSTQRARNQTPEFQPLLGRFTAPEAQSANAARPSSGPSGAAAAAAPDERVDTRIKQFRLTLRQLLLIVLAIAVIAGGVVALTSWRALASAFSGSAKNPAATSTELAFQQVLFTTQTAQARQLTHDYKPTGIGLCDTIDPPYGSTTERSYWESLGTVTCLDPGVTELDQGGKVEFFGFPGGFPPAYQISMTFTFLTSAAPSCASVSVGSVTGTTVSISLCSDGTWQGNGDANNGTVSGASSYNVTMVVTRTTGAVSINGVTVMPPAPLTGETYSIQIDGSGLSSSAGLEVSDFALHPTLS